MKSVLFLIAILLCATPLAAQTHFYLDAPFQHPAKIPDRLVPLLLGEIKSTCPRETVSQTTHVRSWFSASRITINNHRPTFIVKSNHHCLNGVDNDWFWIFRETALGYRLVLSSGTISLDVLQTKLVACATSKPMWPQLKRITGLSTNSTVRSIRRAYVPKQL